MRILVLSTYPVTDASHGGQHRLKNIIATLTDKGHIVQSCGVLGSSSYTQTPGFLPFPGSEILSRYIANPFLMEDWAIGQLCVHDDEYYSALSKKIESTPHIILCEQPWMMPFALRFRTQFPTEYRPTVIYGSQNIECTLKKQIVQQYLGNDKAISAHDIILQCEILAIKSAEIICCVSEQDASWHRSKGAKRIIIASNGVVDRQPAFENIHQANIITGGRKFALYCASGHPPNIDGFYELFGQGVGCFSPETKLVVAGSAGAAIKTHRRFGTTPGLSDVLVDGGVVSEAQLGGLLSTTHAIILPITTGGGTNLKAAEAIWTGSHIVTTTKAMRGFEDFSMEKGIYISDTPGSFCRSVERCMKYSANSIGPLDREKRSRLLWSNTLKPLADIIDQMERYQ